MSGKEQHRLSAGMTNPKEGEKGRLMSSYLSYTPSPEQVEGRKGEIGIPWLVDVPRAL